MSNVFQYPLLILTNVTYRTVLPVGLMHHICINFRNNLAVVGSAMYATFLVMFGLIIFVADIVVPQWEVAEVSHQHMI